MAKSIIIGLHTWQDDAARWRRRMENLRSELRQQAAESMSAMAFFAVEVSSSFDRTVRIDFYCDDVSLDALKDSRIYLWRK